MDPQPICPENYYVYVMLNKVKLKDLMSKNVIALNEDEPFSRVEEVFREKNIRHLPIINGKGKLVGIVTQRDLYRVQSPRIDEDGNWFYDKEALNTHILKVAMTKDPKTLGSENTVADALLLMVDKKYGSIPIVEKNGELCGIITQIDILKMAAAIVREGKGG